MVFEAYLDFTGSGSETIAHSLQYPGRAVAHVHHMSSKSQHQGPKEIHGSGSECRFYTIGRVRGSRIYSQDRKIFGTVGFQ